MTRRLSARPIEGDLAISSPARAFAQDALRFVLAQISAASFAILLLAMIVASRLYWPEDGVIAEGVRLYRYDMLLIACIAVQIALIASGWESWREAKAIAIYHVVGVLMEIFKVSAGSWVYPEPSIAQLGGVPLFTGFMYSAVGSYIARGWVLHRVDFNRFPPLWMAGVVATLIYFNFYTHHYVWDWRYVLFGATCLLFWPVWMRFDFGFRRASLPIVAVFIGVGTLIWVAENIATWANVWLYPQQLGGWRMVSVNKIGSWTLLMILSFVLSASLHRPDKSGDP